MKNSETLELAVKNMAEKNTYSLADKFRDHLGRRLLPEFQREGNEIAAEIIRSSRVLLSIVSSGSFRGYTIFLFLPDAVMQKISISEAKKFRYLIAERLFQSVNLNARLESIKVCFELLNKNDPYFAQSLPVVASSFQNGSLPNDQEKAKKGINLFISHRSEDKKDANILATALKITGIETFVAHVDIEPTKAWRDRIREELQVADALLVLAKEDYAQRPWINQEIGFAYCRGIPIICLKLDEKDPCGFMASEQALTPQMPQNIPLIADEITKILILKFPNRIREAIIDRFVNSGSWNNTRKFYAYLKILVPFSFAEASRLMQALKESDEIREAWGVGEQHGELKSLLRNNSNGSYKMDENDKIVPVGKSQLSESDLDAEVPF